MGRELFPPQFVIGMICLAVLIAGTCTKTKKKPEGKGQPMRKTISIVLALLGAALAAGTNIVHYFTVHRMGMVRHMTYLNGKWEQAYPLPAMVFVLAVVLLALTVLLCALRIRKRKPRGAFSWVLLALAIAIGVYAIMFVFSHNAEAWRDYYLDSLMLGVGWLLALLAVPFWPKKKPKSE